MIYDKYKHKISPIYGIEI